MTSATAPAHLATLDPGLHARIVARHPLRYDAGPDPREDRPGHVRAASGVAWLGERLAVVQDDLAFVALVGLARTGVEGRSSGSVARVTSVEAIPLPRGAQGRRRFEERLGNKRDKFDLESCFVVAGPSGPRLLAFGSGTLAVRRHVALLELGAEEAQLVPADALYEALRSAFEVPAADLNVEGALVRGDDACFLLRGSRAQASAIASVPLEPLVAWLVGGATGAAPGVRHVERHDLGTVGSAVFGFTDGVALPDGRVVVLAAAEDTDDPVDDGAVLGMRLGVSGGGPLRLCPLLDERGEPACDKAEGITLDPERTDRLWLVTDADDVDRPAELLEVAWGDDATQPDG